MIIHKIIKTIYDNFGFQVLKVEEISENLYEVYIDIEEFITEELLLQKSEEASILLHNNKVPVYISIKHI